MDKYQALQAFWESFDLPAYDENSIPDYDPADENSVNRLFPFISYAVETDSLGSPVAMTASVWYRSSTWEAISKKTEQIAQRIYEMNAIPLDTGYLYITKGTPFAQRMDDPADNAIRRMYLNIMAEYLTAF